MELVCQNGLFAPAAFWELSQEDKHKICNGCGAKSSLVDFVPDEVWGANFSPACDIHDFFYWLGIDKREADRVFLVNLLYCCNIDCPNDFVYVARVEMAVAYYKAVMAFGGDSFGTH